MDLLVLQGDVDEFREITGIINRDMDLVTLSDENLRRVFMIFEIAFGVVNARTKPVTEADLDQLWCSSVDSMVAVAKQVFDYASEMTFQDLDEQWKQAVLGMLRGARNVISKQSVLNSTQQGVIEELLAEVGLTRDERLLVSELESQSKEHDLSVEACCKPCISWPRNGRITVEWIQVLISTLKWSSWKDPKEFHNVIPVTVVKKLINAASKIMRGEKNCVKIHVKEDSEVVIVGDIHGQFHDLIALFEENTGFPSDRQYFVFNGNYVGGGSWGLEVLLVLLAWKVLIPHRVFLLRGNHESKDCTLTNGFWSEICTKFGLKECKSVYDKCLESFKAFPLASVIANSLYTTHGGLFRSEGSGSSKSSKSVKRRKLNTLCLGSLKELAKVNRFLEDVPENSLLADVLWSDPSLETGIRENKDKRSGLLWGPDYTEEFLSENHLKLIIRSHEGPDARTGHEDSRNLLNGYSKDHDVASGQLYTLFTAPSYAQFGGFDNVGAYAVIKPPKFDSPIFLPLKAAKRPEAPLYDSFLYEDFDSDGAEDFVSTDSEEEHNLTLRDAIEPRDMTLMETNIELNKKMLAQGEKIKQLESLVEELRKEQGDRAKRMEDMLSTLLQQSSHKGS
ncbi:serine/threonine-protein phosphatase 7-like isoform X2 [Mangifera indica]|uniref:serine/threonine-protein phosphatase 7-like isoform X2 n=1 Tax=Mangifera indica TaxID=29780 RepID=UPI001CF9C248|nr:serine/threonine-protein phosphatase 7-like isoform X2 [Mangifera indica]